MIVSSGGVFRAAVTVCDFPADEATSDGLLGCDRAQLLAAVARLDAAIAQRDTDVAQLRELVIERDGQLAERDARLSEQHIRLIGLAEQIAELQARAGRDSSNSSTPPSSDSPYTKRKAKRGLRGSSGRKPGKQPGAQGETPRQVDDPDEIVRYELAEFPACGRSRVDAPVVGMSRRQVFDPLPPPPRPHVTEYQMVKRRCRCGAQVAGPAPTGVLAPVSYGPGAAALAVYAGSGQYLPVKRAAGVTGHPGRQDRTLAGLRRLPVQ